MTKRRLTINLSPEQVAGLSLKDSDINAAVAAAIDSYIAAPAPAAGEDAAALRAELEQAKRQAKAAADKAAAELGAARVEVEQAVSSATACSRAADKLEADLRVAKEANLELWERIGALLQREENWQRLVGEVIKTALK